MINPLHYLIAFVRILLLVIPMAIFLALYVLLTSFLFKNTPDRAFKLRRIYVRYACFVMGIFVQREGKAHSATALYVSNHRSMSDPLILSQFVDAFIIAKAEVGQIPIISTGAKITGIIFVKRENKNSRSAVRQKMTDTLESGFNVLVYPEGTVNHNLRPLPYRPGTFAAVASLGIPIVPVVLEYKNQKDLWHNRSMVAHFFLQFGHLFTKAKIAIGPPISNSDPEILKQAVEDWTMNKILEIHKNWNSVFTEQVKSVK